MLMRYCWTVFSLWLIVSYMLTPFDIKAQTKTSELLQGIRLAPTQVEMQRCLSQLWQIDSTQTYLVAESVASTMTQSRSLTRPQADTLLRIYAIGRTHDPAGPTIWLLRRAMLAHSQSPWYDRLLLRWSIEAIVTSPEDVPSYLVMQTGRVLAKEQKATKITLKAATTAWTTLEHVVFLRQIANGKEAAEWAEIQQQLTLEMRSVMPDCKQLEANFSEGLSAGNLDAEACKSFLVLYSLQKCDRPTLWDRAFAVAGSQGDDPWLFRLAAEEAFNRREYAKSRAFRQNACSVEKSNALQAHDQLQIAATYRAEKDYRQARTAIQNAIRLHPTWGEPYVQLIDTYLEGSESCTMSPFERKALYWLLMDICQTLKSTDESYANLADERYFAYQKLCPTSDEAAFQGWKSGDTYPLKCWMSTATRVK